MSQGKFVVDPKDPGCYQTISAAIAAAGEGEKIFVRPGDYTESLDVEKKIELFGDGSMEEVRVLDDGARPLLFTRSPLLMIKNISFINRSNGTHTIVCESGILDIEHCGIEGGEYGIFARPGTRVALEDSFISSCDLAGVFLKKCINATVDNCLIEKCGGPGIIAEDCHNLMVQHCTISDTQPHGIVASGFSNFEVIDTEFAVNSKAVILDNDRPVDAGGDHTWYRRIALEE